MCLHQCFSVMASKILWCYQRGKILQFFVGRGSRNTLICLCKMTPMEIQMCLEQFLVYFASFPYNFFFCTKIMFSPGQNICQNGWLWFGIAPASHSLPSCSRLMTSVGISRTRLASVSNMFLKILVADWQHTSILELKWIGYYVFLESIIWIIIP